MFEPPILNQLMGVGGLLIGFVGVCRHIKLQEKREEEERRETRRARICVYDYPRL